MKGFAKSCFKNIRLNYNYACRRLGLEGYQIHQIVLRDHGLIYIPIPKNACSSVKYALYEIDTGCPFDYQKHRERGYKDIHDYYQKRAESFTGVKRLHNTDSKIFAVIRDPVKRLISCYRNRVVDLKDLEKSKPLLRQLDLPREPDLNTFVMRLEEYREASKLIEHHSRPQYRFLGDSLSYIDEVYPISELGALSKMLQGYNTDLQMRSKKSGGTSYGLKDLSEEVLERAFILYRKDYELLKEYYSPEKIRKEYKEKRSKQ